MVYWERIQSEVTEAVRRICGKGDEQAYSIGWAIATRPVIIGTLHVIIGALPLILGTLPVILCFKDSGLPYQTRHVAIRDSPTDKNRIRGDET